MHRHSAAAMFGAMLDSPTPRRPTAASPALRAGLVAGLALAAFAVFHGALAYFFAQDDFAGLARARGILPALQGPWRYLSGQTYFDLMSRVAGLHPLPYRLASFAGHVATTGLLLALMLRSVSPPAAWLGAMFFAVHPALYTALYSVSGIGEILAAGFGLAALLAAGWPGWRRWAAVPLFALSLLSKESTLLLPLVLWLTPPSVARAGGLEHGRPDSGLRRHLLPAALAALAIVYAGSFLARDTFGVRAGLGASEPYALRFDATLLANGLTYAGWSVDFFMPTVRSFSDAVDPAVFGYGLAGVLVWFAGLAVPALRARGWILGGALCLACLLPVLPLAPHTYHYYLYAPLAGAAMCVAVAASLALERSGARPSAPARGGKTPRAGTTSTPAPGAPAVTWGVTTALAALLALNGAALVRKIETHPFIPPVLRTDPTVDRARIARNVYADLEAAPLPDSVTLRFWSPTSIAAAQAAGRDPSVETYWELNVRNALLDGLAVRVLFPRVRRVEFVRSFTPDADSVRYAVYLLDGHLRVGTPGEIEAALHAPHGSR